MKASQFKRIIHEEIGNVLKEQTQIKPNISAKELKSVITPILAKLERDIDNASKNISIAVTKKTKKYDSPSSIPHMDLMITRKGVEQAKKLITIYTKLAERANTYINFLEDPNEYHKTFGKEVLAEIRRILQENGL